MNFALVSVLIPAIVALIVSMISPVFTHLIWRRQKRKEKQLAVAERFAVLNAEMDAHHHPEDIATRAMNELSGILLVVPVLFKKKEVVRRARALTGVHDPEAFMIRIELEAYLLAEALDLSFDEIVELPFRL